MEHFMSKMTTRVVDLHVKSLRSVPDQFGRTYNNIEEWMSYEENVYIGRNFRVSLGGGKLFSRESSIWSNPFKVEEGVPRTEILDKYYLYICDKIDKENLVDDLRMLKGKNLGCWCHPLECHGDVLVYLIENWT